MPLVEAVLEWLRPPVEPPLEKLRPCELEPEDELRPPEELLPRPASAEPVTKPLHNRPVLSARAIQNFLMTFLFFWLSIGISS